MPSLYHQYYDRIYSGKDYGSEVETILTIARSFGIEAPMRVLDVGCGTGSHSLLLADAGCEVTGTDLDADAIAVACTRCSTQTLRFLCQDVAALDADGFDLAVSMFNVVNYIDCPKTLGRFFLAIAERLAPGGVYVFDCWNGEAALIDPPRNEDRDLVVDDLHMTIATRPTLDRMNQSVKVSNLVTVTHPNGTTESFPYDYTSTLWTPRHLGQALIEAGFESVQVCQWMQPDKIADERSWKIMFVCRRLPAR